MFEVLDTEPDVVDRPGARVLTDVQQGIEFDSVTFRYDHEPVLIDVDLSIHRGEVVALVGPSGAGKSTLADLVLRFYDVEGGAIRIDGTDIRELTLTSLRAQIGLVTQHTFLFNDTVRNNIAYGAIDRSMDAIVQAAQDAYAHEFITELPDGYDTMVGELGLRLSGGQRQRIAIARALLKNAPLLVLDEATSALDNESERLVQQALERLMEGRTTLVIAHRLSTIRSADRIVVLMKGRIVEQGTHEQLLALNAEYRKLHDLQFAAPSVDAELTRRSDLRMDEPRVAAEAPRRRWPRGHKSLLRSIAPLAPPVVNAALSALFRTLRVRLVDEEDLSRAGRAGRRSSSPSGTTGCS